ncbi:MAG: class I SAM-dependent methyltransferase [Acidobacteriota bacterium]|nr:class I SAM-dependent methyltransferase [Acidobacteriota bacterium]
MPEWEDTSTRSWDAIADDWVQHADTNDYRNGLLMPFMLELLGDVRGMTILDLGCGEGGYSRELTARGAKVVGVDGSSRLVEIARQRAPGIQYVVANANALEAIESESFEIVMASMSLMDVEDYEGAIDEAWRVLRPGGRLFMSITHPCFSTPVSRWIKSDDGGLQVFAVDRYMQRAEWEGFIATSFQRPVVRRHKPLQDFVGPLLRRGFLLRAFDEPGASVEQIRTSPRLERLNRIPYFLFMTWQKG